MNARVKSFLRQGRSGRVLRGAGARSSYVFRGGQCELSSKKTDTDLSPKLDAETIRNLYKKYELGHADI